MKINRVWILVFVCLIMLCVVPLGLQVDANDEPDTFTVNAVDDSDDGHCDDTHCSLREAIIFANDHAGKDIIEFNIPGQGTHSIVIEDTLDNIHDSVIIDGYS